MARVEAVKTVRIREIPAALAAKIFEVLNSDYVEVYCLYGSTYIITDKEPKDLTYPEGWFYDCGFFRTYWKDENQPVEFYTKKVFLGKSMQTTKLFKICLTLSLRFCMGEFFCI